MANKSGYTITKSNYSVRKKHQNSSNGEILVRDYMTTTTPGAWASDVFSYGESNFKIVTFDRSSISRVHKYGEWVEDPCGNELWNLSCLPDEGDESSVNLNYDYSSMKNFVYYGSCVDALQNSVTGIINKYPAEIYITDIPFSENSEILNDVKTAYVYFPCSKTEASGATEKNSVPISPNSSSNSYIKVNGLYYKLTQFEISDPVLVSNPFEIDILTQNLSTSGNIFRKLSTSYNYYQILKEQEDVIEKAFLDDVDITGSAITWNSVSYSCRALKNTYWDEVNKKYRTADISYCLGCAKINDMFIVVYVHNGKTYTLADKRYKGYVIRPRYHYYSIPEINNVALNWIIPSDGKYYASKKDLPSTANTYDMHSIQAKAGEKYYYSPNGKWVRVIPEYHNPYKEFFNSLTAFESLLMNRDSNPIYTAYLEVPRETEYGILISKKTFQWPLDEDGWNLLLRGDNYEKEYIGGLMDVATLYDEYATDNLWANMTHESIKNMDHTYVNDTRNEDNEDYTVGASRIKMLLSAYSVIFDDLKRYIDNIKNLNTITYDGYDNIADYFLTDSLELSGWELYSVVDMLDTATLIDGSDLFDGLSTIFTPNKVNVKFLKELKINSKNILKAKGTKNSIEQVLSLFGMKSKDFVTNYTDLPYVNESVKWDYDLSEYVCSAYPKISNAEIPLADVEKYNSFKKTYDEFDEDTLQGLPIAVIDTDEEDSYIIPYFNRSKTLDGNIYYQMKGGWELYLNKIVKGFSLSGNTMVYGNNLVRIGGKFYNENLKRIGRVYSLSELTAVPYSELYSGDIYMVDCEDEELLSDYEDIYGEEVDKTTISHFFCIQNKEYSTEFGKLGWTNVSNSELINGIGDGAKVLYLLDIVDSEKGNAPHIGYGGYDHGQEYFRYFDEIFRYSINNDNFTDDGYDCTTGQLLSGITSYGFDGLFSTVSTVYKFTKDGIEYVTENSKDIPSDATDTEKLDDVNYKNILKKRDNLKCWYFYDDAIFENAINKKKAPYKIDYEYATGRTDGHSYAILSRVEKTEIDKIPIESDSTVNSPGTYLYDTDSGWTVYNFEKKGNDNSNDIGANWAILNTKYFNIHFRTLSELGFFAKDTSADKIEEDERVYEYFIENDVMPYVRQVIPSTAIVELSIGNRTQAIINKYVEVTEVDNVANAKRVQYNVNDLDVTYDTSTSNNL